jgi:two-component system, response regulator FlrC
MKITKSAISDDAAAMLPTLATYLNAVLIETVRLDGDEGSPRTRPVRILTESEMALACHRDIIVDFRDGPPSLIPSGKGQPLHIAFGPADMKLGHALIGEAVRSGGPAIGEPASARLMRYAAKIAASEAAVLIQGDTGVGKEGMARFVHNESPRAEGPFIAVNCAALPATMIEAMLFGHKRGAFTGASGESEGLFRAADGGTLFLDEITELPLELQAKLLRALQEGEVLPVGETSAIKVDIRIVAAANRNFAAEVAAGRFREDLYWRLNVMPIEIAPLHERRQDVCAIAATMLLAMQADQDDFAWIEADALQALMAHDFPGNVRELCNMLQRALVLHDGDAITVADFDLRSAPIAPASVPATPVAKIVSAPRPDPIGSGNRVLSGRDLQTRARMAEFEAIESTLEETDGNRRRAAELLGISERTLRYRLADMRELAEAA